MPCVVHPDRWAKRRCSGCSRTLCSDCLVDVFDGHWCAVCKRGGLPRRPADLVVGGANYAATLGILALGLLVIVQRVGLTFPERLNGWLGVVLLVLAVVGLGLLAMAVAWWTVRRARLRPRLVGRARAVFGGLLGAEILLLLSAIVAGMLLG